ncbi:aldo/keto reductase [Streptomyces anulatus]|uniref:aldo/keto reductase n=1 Tax=Streptomyces anulatus TaxID=1892 RepID=UPI003F4CD17F
MPSTTTFRIGGDLTVGRLGFGAMHLPTERPEDRPSAIAVARRAAELGVTATQVCLAWLLDHSPMVLPIPGTSSVAHLEENTAAADIALTPEQRARLDGIAGRG